MRGPRARARAGALRRGRAFVLDDSGCGKGMARALFCGEYENQLYIESPDMNDWHRVKISPAPYGSTDAPLRWTNRAGCSWGLTPMPDDGDGLLVGEDCPYHEDGHAAVMIISQDPFTIKGPFDEPYIRVGTAATGVAAPQLKLLASAEKSSLAAYVLPVGQGAPDWRDLLYLAAVCANSKVNGGRPVVLAPDLGAPGGHQDAIEDFLQRARPQSVTLLATTFNGDVVLDASVVENGSEVQVQNIEGLNEGCAKLAEAWEQAEVVVFAA
eukprot:SAG25_NODE_4002_length_909_cov_1.493827_1_plen_268_part_01